MGSNPAAGAQPSCHPSINKPLLSLRFPTGHSANFTSRLNREMRPIIHAQLNLIAKKLETTSESDLQPCT
jgi:hypothetical protein